VLRPTRERRRGFGLDLCVHRWVDDEAASSGVTLLLLHGFLDAGSSWDLVAEYLAARGHSVLAPDLRGFGASERIASGGYYHFPDYVADVDALVRGLAPERLCLVGHSMGGSIACLYAGACPARVERLVLMEGLGPPAMPPSLAVDRVRRWLTQLADPSETAPRLMSGADEALRRLAKNHGGVDRAVLASRLPHLTRLRADGRLEWAHDPLHRTIAPTPFWADAFRCFLGEIRCPVLFVSGGATGWHPSDEAERLAALARAPRVATLEDAGHMMHWTRPGEVASLLADFIAEP
jgi:pimeloyl-ACP methyl ester carboxylesterase